MTPSDPARALASLVDALAAPEPVPAGGAAAVAAVAMGIAVGTKVARISKAPEEIGDRLAGLAAAVQPTFDADCEAFRAVLLARRDGAAPDALAQAWQRATEVPLAVARLADLAIEALGELRPHGKPALRGDLDAAVALCRAGAHISRQNAALNEHRPG